LTTAHVAAETRWSPTRDNPLVGSARWVLLRNVMLYRRSWAVLAFGVIEPLLYLLSIGVGIGRLIGPSAGLGVAATYPMFVAPGLLATAAMNGAVDAASLGVFQNLRFNNVYQAMLTTPVRPRDIAFGEACWAVLRGAIEATGFLLIMAALGLVRSWWGLLAIPGAILISFAFASVGLAVATAMRSLSDIQLMQLVLLPMFLFSTTFYPISVYPLPVQWLIEILPLYQGIHLVRGPVLGLVTPGLCISALYLLLLGATCLWVATRRFERALQS
jgi:lipooligosaccharide transport system permease protein